MRFSIWIHENPETLGIFHYIIVIKDNIFQFADNHEERLKKTPVPIKENIVTKWTFCEQITPNLVAYLYLFRK